MSNSTGTMVDSVESESVQPLTAADRCDAGCGAQGRVRVHVPGSGVLVFCAHHYRRHEPALASRDVTVDDFTDQID
jgi:hypothetical protein